MSSNAHRIITREIEKIRGPKKRTGTNISILCPFHIGDSKPSCGIYTSMDGKYPIGTFHCLGCGASGHWNKLADKLELEKVRRTDEKVDEVVPDIIMSAKKELLPARRENKESFFQDFGVTICPRPRDVIKWRTIPFSLLSKLDVSYAIDKKFIPHVLLPIRIRSKLVSYIKATIKKSSISYIVADNTPIKTKGLFPFDYVAEMNSPIILLTEGPRDSLRGLQYKLPTLGILGVQNWTTTKMRLLLSMHPKEIWLCMDGDSAGIKAAKKIKNDLKGHIKVRVIKLNRVNNKQRCPKCGHSYIITKEVKFCECCNKKIKLSNDLGNVPKSFLRDLYATYKQEIKKYEN